MRYLIGPLMVGLGVGIAGHGNLSLTIGLGVLAAGLMIRQDVRNLELETKIEMLDKNGVLKK